jgi:hypothetical protein
MGIKTLVQSLMVTIPESPSIADSEGNQLNEVIHQLETKQAKLQSQLESETRPEKRRQLAIQLKTAQLQHEKGLAQLH